MSVTFRAAATTDVGTVRVNNEDAALATGHLVAVADGMGGHAAGEVASGIVMAQLSDLAASAHDGAASLSADSVTETLRKSRNALRAMSAVDPELAGMGTTVVALLATEDGLVLVHVGDSRLYRLRDGEFTQLTVDHTHVQHLVDSGRIAPDAARHHPFRSVILRSLDDTSRDLPDVTVTEELRVGDRVLLCSDGLSDYVLDEDIAAALANGDPQDAADRLVAVALEAATRDNVTALVADVVAAQEPALPAAHLGVAPAEMVLTRSAREAMVRVLTSQVGPEQDDEDVEDDFDADAFVTAVLPIIEDELDLNDAPPVRSVQPAPVVMPAERGESSHVPPSDAAVGEEDASSTPVSVAAEATAEVTPEATAEVTPEVTPETTAEVTPEVAAPARAAEEADPASSEPMSPEAGATGAEPATETKAAPSGTSTGTEPAGPARHQAPGGRAPAASPRPEAMHANGTARPTARDMLWLSLVVVTFAAVAVWVWTTGG